MLKPVSAIAATVAMIATISLASITFAQCGSCGTGDVAFGYPGGSCSTCSTGQGFAGRAGHQHGEYLKAKLEHAKQINAKVSARNQAWPKPFTCADRQIYTAMWAPMVKAGFADQTTITAVHFEEGKLTRYGKQQIAGIMRNMPQNHKVVYVQRDGDQATTQERYNQVQEVVSMFYGQAGRVALTDRNPINQTGTRAAKTTENYYNAIAPPIIPVADGTSTVGSSVSN